MKESWGVWPLALVIAACSGPRGSLYVTSGASDAVVVLDASDGSRLAELSLDRRVGELDEPHGVAVAPDGRHVYATLAHGDPTLWKFERAGDRLVGRLSLESSGAARIAVSADSRTGYVADYERGSRGAPGEVIAVGLHELTIDARARPCAAPHDARPSPSGRVVAVACSHSDEVVFLEAGSLSESARAFVGPEPGSAGAPRYRPLNLAWVGDDLVAVTLAASGEVLLLGVDGEQRGRAQVGAGPAQIAFEAGSGRLVTANRGDGSASILQLEPLAEIRRVELGVVRPHGVDVDAASGTAFVTYEGEVDSAGGALAVDLASGRVLWSVAAGYYTLGVAYAPPR
ncbi:MAG: hypothetical protein ABFS34_10135 [Gemmatimonadota bacterium]